MASDSSAVASAPHVEAPGGIGRTVASVISYTVNPLILPPLVYGLVLIHIGASTGDVVTGASIGAFFLGVIPLVYVGWMRIRGEVGSLEIRNREKRTEPFLIVLASTIAALFVVGALQGTSPRATCRPSKTPATASSPPFSGVTL